MVCLAVLFVASLRDAVQGDLASQNLHAHQAVAFLQGRLDLEKTDLHDVAVFRGKVYSVFPPFPAVVLMPVIALRGLHRIDLIPVSLAVTGLSFVLLRRILIRLGVSRSHTHWMATALFFGTGYWLCVLWSGGVWYFAHIIAVACLLMAIDEAVGPGCGWAAGLAAGLAFLSRQMTIFSLGFLAAVLWTHPVKASLRDRIRAILGLGLGAALCVAVYMLYNYVRFEDPFDAGYAHIRMGGFLGVRFRRYGLFDWRYIPFNALHMFVEGFSLRWLGSDHLMLAGMNRFGTSLTFASPFVFFAVAARKNGPFIAGAWLTVICTIVPTLMYYNNGFVQPNAQRFALDFLPVVIVLVALAWERLTPAASQWLRASIVYAVLLNAVALIVVPFLYHTLRRYSIGWEG